MTKFFANLILSAAVGITAAVGFTPDFKGKVTGMAQEIRATAQGAVQSAFDALAGAHLGFDASLGASAKADSSAGVQTESAAHAEVSTAGGAGLDLSGLLDAGAEANVDATLSAESQTEADAETGEAGFSLTSFINSTLGLGIGK